MQNKLTVKVGKKNVRKVEDNVSDCYSSLLEDLRHFYLF